ncbi:MAG: hypothetical protein ACT4NY_20325 [Pseudonocardiales bacterium]
MEVPVGLELRAVDVAGPCRWRWLLVDERSGVSLADHLVELDPGAAETEAFEDLYRFLRWRSDPNRRVTSEAELVHRVGAWIGSVVLGERICQAIATVAPVTVRVVVPAGAEFLAFRPLGLAHIGGVPVAARGHVALVYDLPGPPRSVKAPVGEALRMLAVFSLPTVTSAAALRRERYELSRLVRRVAERGRRRVELQVAQYGMTRARLADLVEAGDGWDVLHLSGPGGMGEFLLENPDGSADPVSTAELIGMLRPARRRLKLAVVSSCQSAAAATAETLRWLGLDDPAADLETQAALEASATPMGVARALVAQLDCAVVAMRYPAVDEFTSGFAQSLYNRVFRSTQPLDWAVAAAVPDAAGPAPTSARPAISVATPAIFGASAVELSLAPPVGPPVLDPTDEVMARFPAEPTRFVGRVEEMAAASRALAPASGCTTVVFHGMAGVGKTTCAVELAYRRRHAFVEFVFWSAPTDPDQFGEALRLLAMGLEEQLGDYGLAMVDKIATLERLETFLPTLCAVLADVGVLLVLDNLETLLTPDGQWRDLRWAPLISALTGHDGLSRVILTSRIVPAGLNPNTVLVRPVHTLSRDESLLLVRELPTLRTLLYTEAGFGPVEADPVGSDPVGSVLGRRVLTLAQGHPTLLELADAAATDPSRLAFQLAEVEAAVVEAAVEGAALAEFLTKGDTRLNAEQLRQTFAAWTIDAAATLPAPARLLLQVLCRIEETDRSTAVIGVNWVALWRSLDQAGEPPPLASWAAPLVAAGLVAADSIDGPADPNGPVHYRIHPGVVEAILAATPQPVTAAVYAQLTAYWTVVGDWGIEQQRAGKDTSRLVLRATLAAARYLLRQPDWNAASCLLERALRRDSYAPATSLAVIPLLRRIAEATGALKDLVVLAAALRKLDPGEAETLLRRAYEQTSTGGDYPLASTTCGELITLLRDQGRLREALTLAGRKIEHSSQAGFGSWTQLSDQGRRLQILSMLGHQEQVLLDVSALRIRMAELPDQGADNDRVNPWNVREGILDVGRLSAVALARWDEALDLNDEIARTRQRRGASAYEAARARFNNYLPLLRLGRLTDVDQLLRDCQDVFDTVGDPAELAAVYGARADLAAKLGNPQDAVDLQRTALRLWYVHPDPRDISTAHHNLANYLSHASANPAEHCAHRLTAALLNHLTGDTSELTKTLSALTKTLAALTKTQSALIKAPGVLVGELRGDSSGPGAPVPPTTPMLPTTLAEVTDLVDAGDGVHFGKLVVALCPDRATAEDALADLLATVDTSADRQADQALVGADYLLAAWGPVITAVVAMARNDGTPHELTELLDDIATTDWAALVTALRRVLAGDRSRELLLAGLDDIGTAILTATLDQLSTHPGQ